MPQRSQRTSIAYPMALAPAWLASVAVLAFTLVLACLLPAEAATTRRESAMVPLGLNLSGVVDWSSDIVFVDAFKAARKWISQREGQPWGQGGPLKLDDRGHVLELAPGQFAETIVYTGFERRYPAGVFTALYEGDGDLDFRGDARVVKRQPGRLQVEIQPKSGQVTARITRTNPENPLRGIRLIHPGFENQHVDRPFHPEFLKRWAGFAAYRFMDWAETNNSKLTRWRDRPTPDHHSQALHGVAPEYLIQLANTQQTDAWFCIPHLADDEFIREYALLVKAQLDPARKVYVEYSNECWNGQFEQARYCQDQGKKLGLSQNAFEGQLRFYSQRSVEVFKIWQAVLGKDRLVCVLAAQSANPWTGETILAWRDAAHHANAIAIAPYFGNRFGDPKHVASTLALTPEQLCDRLAKDIDANQKVVKAYARLAQQHNMTLLAYEGGQHLAGFQGAENNDKLTALFHAANRHPKMKQLYLQDLRQWQNAGGGLFCIFSSMGTNSKWGSWGLLEHTDQDVQQAPKWQAVREWLGGNVR